jgi:hypothetical protein
MDVDHHDITSDRGSDESVPASEDEWKGVVIPGQDIPLVVRGTYINSFHITLCSR